MILRRLISMILLLVILAAFSFLTAVGKEKNLGQSGGAQIAVYTSPATSEIKIGAKELKTPLAGWRKWTVERPGMQTLDVYIAGDTTEKKPVLLLVTGSKCRPVFDVKENGKVNSPLFTTDASFYRKTGFITVVMERRGVKSFEPIPPEIAAIDIRTRCRDDYGALSKFDRVKDLEDCVRALRREKWFGKLAILGHSEGVDVTTGLAKTLGDQDILALGLMAGASPSQFGDFILEARAQKDNIKAMAIFDDVIWLTSEKAEGKYGGYPLKRWRSYAIESTPMEDVRESMVPVFVANGSRDTHAPIGGADTFVLELLRRQEKRNVLYLSIADLDHNFMDAKGNDLSLAVIKEFAAWALSSDKGRKVLMSLPVH